MFRFSLVIIVLSKCAWTLELIKPLFIEKNMVDVNLLQNQKIAFEKGENYTYYIGGDVLAQKYGAQFYTKKCGTAILNIPMIDNIDYSIIFNVTNILPQHVICIGIASEGYLVSEVLQLDGYDTSCLSKYQKGFCSDNRRSHLYKDLYTNYNEFDDEEKSKYINDLFNLGEQSEESIFSMDTFSMNLQGESLTFLDLEKNKIIASFDMLDRKRTYLPIIVIRKIKDDQYLHPPTPKKKKKQIVQEENNNIDCSNGKLPEDLTNQDQQQEVAKDLGLDGNEEGETQLKDSQNNENSNNIEPVSFLQNDWVDLLLKPFTKVEEKKVSPIVVEQAEEEEEEQIGPPVYTILEVLEIQSHALLDPVPEQFDKKIKPLRESIQFNEENQYIIYQQNLLLPSPLQPYESCSYAYLAVPPFSLKSNILLQVSIVQLDFTNGVYPIGFGVIATEMLDQFRGWRNAQSQIWCLDKDLLQYGALYRTDGTFFDSYILGEYNKYQYQQSTNRQGTIKMYFTKGNRVVYRIGKDKHLYVTCVNSRYKYFTPFFELKSWKGKPILRVDEFENHHAMPFEFSDSDNFLYENFGQEHNWVLLNKFFTEKRGHFNFSDDDYTLSNLNGTTDSQTASMNMWETSLFDLKFEWFVKIDEIELTPRTPTQICIGVHQISQEIYIEKLLLKNSTAQVAYICDKNDFAHTFFEECPIYENPITLVKGSVIRFRLSNYLLEVSDSYNTVYFTLRKAGNTAVVPSIILRGGNNQNKVTFLRSAQKKGPNPTDTRVKDQNDLVNYQNFVSYDIFTLANIQNLKDEKMKLCWEDQQQKEVSAPPPPALEQPEFIATTNQLLTHQVLKVKEAVSKDKTRSNQYQKATSNAKTNDEQKIEYLQNNLPIEITQDNLEQNIQTCLTLYSQCHYQGRNIIICGNHHSQKALSHFQSAKRTNPDLKVELMRQRVSPIQESFTIDSDIECLSQPLDISDFDFYFKI